MHFICHGKIKAISYRQSCYRSSYDGYLCIHGITNTTTVLGDETGFFRDYLAQWPGTLCLWKETCTVRHNTPVPIGSVGFSQVCRKQNGTKHIVQKLPNDWIDHAVKFMHMWWHNKKLYVRARIFVSYLHRPTII